MAKYSNEQTLRNNIRNNLYGISNLSNDKCNYICNREFNKGYTWNTKSDKVGFDPNTTEFHSNSDNWTGDTIGNHCLCSKSKNKKTVKIPIDSYSDRINKNSELVSKVSKYYWIAPNRENVKGIVSKIRNRYVPRPVHDSQINDYSTPWQCGKDTDGNYKSSSDYFIKKEPCFSMEYIELFLIMKILKEINSEDGNKKSKILIESEKILVGIEKIMRELYYNKKKTKLNTILKYYKFKDVIILYTLLLRGLLVGDYNIVNRDCVLHCGKCGKCSTEKDLEVIYRTRKSITSDMTSCAISYAGLLGHKDKNKLEECLRDSNKVNEVIDFTPMCREGWYRDIDCAGSYCKPLCINKFFAHGNTDKLNSCTECDEEVCGPEFIHVGANRRSSGIISDIRRNNKSRCKSGIYYNYDDNQTDIKRKLLNDIKYNMRVKKGTVNKNKSIRSDSHAGLTKQLNIKLLMLNDSDIIDKFRNLMERYLLQVEKKILLLKKKPKQILGIAILYDKIIKKTINFEELKEKILIEF